MDQSPWLPHRLWPAFWPMLSMARTVTPTKGDDVLLSYRRVPAICPPTTGGLEVVELRAIWCTVLFCPLYWVAKLRVPVAVGPAACVEELNRLSSVHSPAFTLNGEVVAPPPLNPNPPPLIWMDWTCKTTFPLLQTQQDRGRAVPTGTKPQLSTLSLMATERQVGPWDGGSTVVMRSKNWG